MNMYKPYKPWNEPLHKAFAWGFILKDGLLDHIPRIPESVDTSMAAFWYRNGHQNDLMQREIWGGFRGVSV